MHLDGNIFAAEQLLVAWTCIFGWKDTGVL